MWVKKIFSTVTLKRSISDINTGSLTKIFSKNVTMLLMVYILKKLINFPNCKEKDRKRDEYKAD